MAYFGCLGHFIDGSGGPLVLTECGVLASGSLRGFLLGKHYNRCKRLHPLLATAMQSLHFLFFLETAGPLGTELTKMLHDVNTSLSPITLAQLEGSEEYFDLMSKYDAFCAETLRGKHGATAQFWMTYIQLVQRFLLFNRACRTNDVSLFIYSLEQLIPIFFSGNRPNYSRWMIRYHLNLLNAEESHPGIMSMLEGGAFSVRRTAKSFSRTAVDMTLEQTVNADAASRHTGMGSFVHSENARRRWMVTRAARSSIVGALLQSAGLYQKEDTTQDLKHHRVKRDHSDLEKIQSGIQATMNPFGMHPSKELYCLTSGKSTSDLIKNDLLNFTTNGESWSSEFRDACFQDPGRFEKAIPRRKNLNFASASVKSTVTVGKKVKEVAGTRDLFGRLLLLSTKERIDLEKVLQYPLTPVPLSLAHTDGSMNTTDKSKLLHKIEDHMESSITLLETDVVIVDATFFLHLQKDLPMTFGEIAALVLRQLVRMAKEVHLVCDVYRSPSIKDAERERRGTALFVYNITGPDQVRPKDWQQALHSASFKTEFFKFLADEWKKPSYAHIMQSCKLFLAVEDTCFSFTSVDDGVLRTIEPSLKSFHEEADTRMIFHLSVGARSENVSNIVVRSNDTDVLVLLVYHVAKTGTNTGIWMDLGLNSNNSRRTVSINNLVQGLTKDVALALPGLHALTGCDYIPSFYNKGKIKPYDMMKKNDAFIKSMQDLGNGPLQRDTIQQCELFICSLYGQPKQTSVDQARHKIFQQTYAPKNVADPLDRIKGVNPSAMPPCSKVLLQQLKRANYVASMWKQASQPNPCTDSPVGHGWTLDGSTYRIHWYDGDQLPTDIFQSLATDDTHLTDECEDEAVAYGESLFGEDESDNDE